MGVLHNEDGAKRCHWPFFWTARAQQFVAQAPQLVKAPSQILLKLYAKIIEVHEAIADRNRSAK
ncbi:hypothetical protein V2I01_15295 [Micromonospora sp. BRA006-A]|nr:hypothetical protein [Micromonospora sp. BRA006-A]